jgi:ketosteroid isomerase-like protein
MVPYITGTIVPVGGVAMTASEVFMRAHALVSAYDIRFVDCFAEHGVLELPFAPPPLPRRVVGREAIRALLQPRYDAARAAGRRLVEYRDLRLHETRDPEVIVAEFAVLGVPPGAGREPQTLPFIQVYRMVGDQIVLQRDYFDSLAMAERLRAA